MAGKRLKILFDILNQLRSGFGLEIAIQRENIFFELSNLSISNNSDINTYHELLLFYCTYPDNSKVLLLCKQELERMTKQLKKNSVASSKNFDKHFAGSGIVYSKVKWSPSFDGCLWLLTSFGADVQIEWSDEFITKLGTYISSFAAPVEQDGLVDNRFDAKDWLLMASGRKGDFSNNELSWLLNHFKTLSLETKIRDQFFEALEMEIVLKLNAIKNSRTGNILDCKEIYFQHDPLLRSFDPIKKVNEPLIAFNELYGKEKSNILQSSKSVLAARERETDPVFMEKACLRLN
ncbi:MAG: hypothetical protein IPP71_11660 [Bacteroidetes bacterium]|nr:hypothetical protein [Bacteroidota bacterium]